jgi:hypothetical protein
MTRAVLKDGVFYPLEAIPQEWHEGTEVRIEQYSGDSDDDSQGWMELEALCAHGDPADDARLEAAIRDVRAEAKEMMRRRMGLPQDGLRS